MMKKIIYHRASDGGLSVIHPVINTHVVVDDELVPHVEDITEDEALERAMKDVPTDAIDVQVVEESAIPTDRTFREAWVGASGSVAVDMPKAKEVHKNRLRVERAAKMADADAQFFKALEAWLKTQPSVPAALTAVMAKKQALRDVTADPAISAAATPEELKAVTPQVLR